MNDYMRGPRGGYDAMYYWDQFHPILSAIAILVLGWIIALLVSAGVKNLAKTRDQYTLKCSDRTSL